MRPATGERVGRPREGAAAARRPLIMFASGRFTMRPLWFQSVAEERHNWNLCFAYKRRAKMRPLAAEAAYNGWRFNSLVFSLSGLISICLPCGYRWLSQ